MGDTGVNLAIILLLLAVQILGDGWCGLVSVAVALVVVWSMTAVHTAEAATNPSRTFAS
jgi:hypothetical protein